jgi:hypothetical protein
VEEVNQPRPRTVSVTIHTTMDTAGTRGATTEEAMPRTGASAGLVTVTKALQTAGGIKPLADLRHSVLVQLNPNGSGTKRKIKINLANELSNPHCSKMMS